MAVVVPFHDAAPTVAATVRAIRAQTAPVRRVLLVDDGSVDDGAAAAAAAAEGDARVEILRRPSRGGEAAALNAALARLFAGPDRPDFLAVVEADVVPEPGWLAAALQAFAAGEDVGGVGGILKGFPEDPWIARLAAYEVEDRFPTFACDVRHVTSAAAVYRWEVFERLGGFREDLVNAGLDSEFNARARAAGYILRFTPEAAARHRYKGTLGGYLSRQFAYGKFRRAAPLLLYPQDRVAALEAAATLLFLAGGALLAALSARAAIWSIACAAAMHLPFIARQWLRRRDPAVLTACFVFPLRYLVAAAGVVRGLAAAGPVPPAPRWPAPAEKNRPGGAQRT